MNETDKVYSQQEAADYLGISLVTLWRLRRDKQIGCIKLPKNVKFTQKHLDEYLQRYEVPAETAEVSE